MADARIPYKRLPGRGALRATTIWLGPDHLLHAELSGIAEEYKRFYFRDIQAIIVRRTKAGFIINTICGALCCLFGTLALSDDWGWWIVFAFPTIMLIANTIMGPTCKTSLKTAVQLEKLTPWGRVRRVRRGIARIRENIAAAQGEISPDDAMARLSPLENRPPVASEPAPPAVADTPPAPDTPASPEAPPQPSPSPSPE